MARLDAPGVLHQTMNRGVQNLARRNRTCSVRRCLESCPRANPVCDAEGICISHCKAGAFCYPMTRKPVIQERPVPKRGGSLGRRIESVAFAIRPRMVDGEEVFL